jgi:hypothetical protein
MTASEHTGTLFCGLRGAAGSCWAAAYRRFNYGDRIAALHGLAGRVSPAGLRQNPPRLHPYLKVVKKFRLAGLLQLDRFVGC